jgi:hypothetical protein
LDKSPEPTKFGKESRTNKIGIRIQNHLDKNPEPTNLDESPSFISASTKSVTKSLRGIIIIIP